MRECMYYVSQNDDPSQWRLWSWRDDSTSNIILWCADQLLPAEPQQGFNIKISSPSYKRMKLVNYKGHPESHHQVGIRNKDCFIFCHFYCTRLCRTQSNTSTCMYSIISIRATSWSVALMTYISVYADLLPPLYNHDLFYQIDDATDKNYIQCLYDYQIPPNDYFTCDYVSIFLYSAASCLLCVPFQ